MHPHRHPTLHRVSALANLVMVAFAFAAFATQAVAGTLRDLSGIWIRTGDSFAGMIIEILPVGDNAAATVWDVPAAATSYGFRVGDVKIKDFAPVGPAAFHAKGLVKQTIDGDEGVEVTADYTDIRLELLDPNRLRVEDQVWVNRPLGNVQSWERVLKTDPRLAGFYYHKGRAAEVRLRYPEALAHYRTSIELNGKDATTRNSLAWLLSTCPTASVRNPREALTNAHLACEWTGKENPALLDTLAAAYAAAGDFPEAIDYQERALARVAGPERGDYAARLALYRQKKPYFRQDLSEFEGSSASANSLTTSLDAEANRRFEAEFESRFTLFQGCVFGWSSDDAGRSLIQLSNVVYSIKPIELSNADRLNRIEYAGLIQCQAMAGRRYSLSGHSKGWASWDDHVSSWVLSNPITSAMGGGPVLLKLQGQWSFAQWNFLLGFSDLPKDMPTWPDARESKPTVEEIQQALGNR